MARVRVATLVLCLFGALGAVAPALASAGSISGTVTAAAGGGIGGVEVCPTPKPYDFEVPCAETNGGGDYELTGLRQSDYYLHFSAARNNLNYVNQFYNGKAFYPGDLVAVGASEAKTGVDAVLQPGGTIAGNVTDAISHSPVTGFPVCAFSNSVSGEVGRCWHTDGSGNYAINGLPPASYEVEFLGEGAFNYLTQYYSGASSSGAATPVEIEAAEQVRSSIDAALQPGAEISGTLTEVGTHKPLSGVDVSLLAPATEEVLKFVETDAAGHYAFRGRPTGSYVVGFSHTMYGPWNPDCYSAQYYKGSATFAGATPLIVAGPGVIPGIDGEVSDICPEPIQPTVKVTLIPTPPAPPLKCKKHFKKKRVHGTLRCVKKHHRHRRRGHGPHAVATGR
jgi:hypothetical protein